MDGLSEDHEYKVTVTATNQNGEESDDSNEIEMRTINVNAGAPNPLNAGASTRNSISFSWTKPAETGGAPIASYNIVITESTGKEAPRKKSTRTTSFTMDGLSEDHKYKVRITAVNGNGEES